VAQKCQVTKGCCATRYNIYMFLYSYVCESYDVNFWTKQRAGKQRTAPRSPLGLVACTLCCTIADTVSCKQHLLCYWVNGNGMSVELDMHV